MQRCIDIVCGIVSTVRMETKQSAMNTTKKPDVELYASDSHGIYIPQYFAKTIKRDCLSGVSDADLADLLAGPDSDTYWDTWDDVLNSAKITDGNGNTFFLHQDGDLWLVPSGMEWSEERDCFEYPFEGESFTAPAAWASYLVNGDASGISEAEKQEIDRVAAGLGSCVDAIECGFKWRPDYGMAGDCCEYRFL